MDHLERRGQAEETGRAARRHRECIRKLKQFTIQDLAGKSQVPEEPGIRKGQNKRANRENKR